MFEDPSIFSELEDLLADSPIENAEKTTSSRVASSGDGSKKSAHKLTERQRRQEMSALYASLRSLLPLQYVKGKRAASDHMHQAVNYIDDMKKKMEELKKKREELRNTTDDPSTKAGDSSPCVKINPLRDGIFEILISSNLNFPLSKVLAELLNRQLNVINCFSTTANSSYLHTIHIQLKESTSIDLPELQEQLQNWIRFAQVCGS